MNRIPNGTLISTSVVSTRWISVATSNLLWASQERKVGRLGADLHHAHWVPDVPVRCVPMCRHRTGSQEPAREQQAAWV